jgi:hypothetical protein
VAAGKILELACPTAQLAAKAGDDIEFYVEILRSGVVTRRVPGDGAIRAKVPLA